MKDANDGLPGKGDPWVGGAVTVDRAELKEKMYRVRMRLNRDLILPRPEGEEGPDEPTIVGGE